jgi:hypothetical protein
MINEDALVFKETSGKLFAERNCSLLAHLSRHSRKFRLKPGFQTHIDSHQVALETLFTIRKQHRKKSKNH